MGAIVANVKIAVGSDHAGFELKELVRPLLEEGGHEVVDVGTDSEESTDYPRHAADAARMVASGEAERAVLVCGSGVGVSIVANKVDGVRAVNAHDAEEAEMSRRHNNANVLALAGRSAYAGPGAADSRDAFSRPSSRAAGTSAGSIRSRPSSAATRSDRIVVRSREGGSGQSSLRFLPGLASSFRGSAMTSPAARRTPQQLRPRQLRRIKEPRPLSAPGKPLPSRNLLVAIDLGNPLPYEEDGQTFQNREGLLPDQPFGYYREYTVETPGSPDRGARRLVIGEQGRPSTRMTTTPRSRGSTPTTTPDEAYQLHR